MNQKLALDEATVRTTGRMLFGDVGPYPILRMRQWYADHADELLIGFDEELDLYTLNGEVHSTKTLFAMFRPVVAGADAAPATLVWSLGRTT